MHSTNTMSPDMIESIPSLEITALPNGNLRLEDKSYGEGAIVDVHPCQIRLMAERLGFGRTPGRTGNGDIRVERLL